MNKKLFLFLIALTFIAGHSNVYSADSLPMPNTIGWEALGDTQLSYWQTNKMAISAGALAGMWTLGLSEEFGSNNILLNGGLALGAALTVGYREHGNCTKKISKADSLINGKEKGIASSYRRLFAEIDNPENAILLISNKSNKDFPRNKYTCEDDLSIYSAQEVEDFKSSVGETGVGELPEGVVLPQPKARFSCSNFLELSHLTSKEYDQPIFNGANMTILNRVEIVTTKVYLAILGLPEEDKRNESYFLASHRVWYDQPNRRFTYLKPRIQDDQVALD